MNKTKLICFDIDGTLVDENSWLFLTKELGCSTKIHLDILKKASEGVISFRKAEQELTNYYIKSGRANRKNIEEIFNKLQPKPEAYEVFEYLKDKGYKIYLISGAINIYVENIADLLNADGWYSNSELFFDSYGDLIGIHYQENQAEIKLIQLKELAKKLHLNEKEITFVGDSDNDLEVFKETKNGIALLPAEKNLLKVAKIRINSLSELLNIF